MYIGIRFELKTRMIEVSNSLTRKTGYDAAEAKRIRWLITA